MSIWWNVNLMKCQFDEMSIWCNVNLMKCQFDEMSIWWNVNLMKYQFVEMLIWWIVKLKNIFDQFDKMSIWWNVNLTKWEVYEMWSWWKDLIPYIFRFDGQVGDVVSVNDDVVDDGFRRQFGNQFKFKICSEFRQRALLQFFHRFVLFSLKLSIVGVDF